MRNIGLRIRNRLRFNGVVGSVIGSSIGSRLTSLVGRMRPVTAALMIAMLLGMPVRTDAAVSVSTIGGKPINLDTRFGGPAQSFTTIDAPAPRITESAAGDIATTITLNAPTGWAFSVVAPTTAAPIAPSNIVLGPAVVFPLQITVPVITPSTTPGPIEITNIRMRPNGCTAPGLHNVLVTTDVGGAGDLSSGTLATITLLAGPALTSYSLASDSPSFGGTPITITMSALDGCGNLIPNAVVPSDITLGGQVVGLVTWTDGAPFVLSNVNVVPDTATIAAGSVFDATGQGTFSVTNNQACAETTTVSATHAGGPATASTPLSISWVDSTTDSDGDGVINCVDACPDTPVCAPVDQTGCPADLDSDGVFDGCDRCPDTVAGDPVDANGCSSTATFTVTNLDDAGAGSLRDAIDQANASAGVNAIVFQEGLTGTIAPASELPTITEAVSILGPGPRLLTITGSNTRRVLSTDAPLTISGLRLANGFTDRGGGILFNSMDGSLRVSDCHFDQHLAAVNGGAICMLAGSATIERCTFTTDQAAGEGGCIWYGQGGGSPTMTITNCTFVNNFASSNGGAIRQSDTTAYASAITNCTFVVNNAGAFGGAIAVAGGTMTLLNSLFTANGAGGNPGGHVGSVDGTITSLGHNLFGHLDGSNFAPDATDKFGVVTAQLNTGILIAFPFDNGGLTDTLPFASSSSIAIDGGGVVGAPTSDQRGFQRVGCAPDVGAFELQTGTDTDGDGAFDGCDNCPNVANADQADSDADGVGNACAPAPPPPPSSGPPVQDADGDGVNNALDTCANTPANAVVDAMGCAAAQRDTDEDSVNDDLDECANTPEGTEVDADGCPVVIPVDGDLDGVADEEDNCPVVANANQADRDNDGVGDACAPSLPEPRPDADEDGVNDEDDDCADTPDGADVDAEGCAAAQRDSDEDLVSDDVDQCDNTPAGTQVGADGCPLLDDDGDGIADEEDNCPDVANADQADSDDDGVGDACDDDFGDDEPGQNVPENGGQGQLCGNGVCGVAGFITLWPIFVGLMLLRRRRL